MRMFGRIDAHFAHPRLGRNPPLLGRKVLPDGQTQARMQHWSLHVWPELSDRAELACDLTRPGAVDVAADLLAM